MKQVSKSPLRVSAVLPWEEEKFGMYSDHGRALARLYRENAGLKAQLRALNREVDTVLFEMKAKKSLPMPKNTVKEELSLAQTQLSLCEREHAALTVRVQQLSNPSYEIQLAEQISRMEKQRKSLEFSLQHLEKSKFIRDKILEKVLETGEMPEMVKDLGYQITKIEIYQSLNRKIEQNIEETRTHLDKLAQRDRILTSEITTLMQEIPQIDTIDRNNAKLKLNEAKNELILKEKTAKYSILKLKNRLKEVKMELNEVNSVKEELVKLLDVKNTTSREFSKEIRSLSPLIHTRRSPNSKELASRSFFMTQELL